MVFCHSNSEELMKRQKDWNLICQNKILGVPKTSKPPCSASSLLVDMCITETSFTLLMCSYFNLTPRVLWAFQSRCSQPSHTPLCCRYFCLIWHFTVWRDGDRTWPEQSMNPVLCSQTCAASCVRVRPFWGVTVSAHPWAVPV